MIPKPEKPHWRGPSQGITQSLLIRFCECPFRFYLYAYCGLQDPGVPHENLVWGDSLHKGLEHRLRGDSFIDSYKHMKDYLQSRYPTFMHYEHTLKHMLYAYPIHNLPYFPVETEYVIHQYVNVTPTTRILYRGKVDLLSKENKWFGDHKCKGRLYPYETMTELNHDLQMNLYAYILEMEDWYYELIQIPEEAYRLPERKASQSLMQYADFIFNKYSDAQNGFPIGPNINRWIIPIKHFQPMEDINHYFHYTIAPLSLRLIEFWDYVSSPDFDPNNPECYNSTFYQMPARMFDPSRTDKFKAHFHGILTKKMEYCDLIPAPPLYSELP